MHTHFWVTPYIKFKKSQLFTKSTHVTTMVTDMVVH